MMDNDYNDNPLLERRRGGGNGTREQSRDRDRDSMMTIMDKNQMQLSSFFGGKPKDQKKKDKRRFWEKKRELGVVTEGEM